MPTISANTTQTITLEASTLMRGIGAAVLSWGTPLQTVTHTAGDEWHLGPFTAAQAVSIHAQSLLTYSTQAVSDDDPVDKLGLKFDGGLTDAQVQAVQALVDGSGTDVALVRSFDDTAMSFTLDAGSGNTLPVLRATVQAPTDTIAGQRITSGGPNTFETTIDGSSTVGEVIAVSVGAALITQVHVGLSTGSEQGLDANGTVVAGELAKWVCDAADDCQMVYIRFAPPRGSGRYCDVSVVGKRRGG